MRTEQLFPGKGGMFEEQVVSGLSRAAAGVSVTRHTAIGFLLVIALLAFEIFNFDTTRYALTNLLGEASFARISWAAILAVAFCAIDFAGLAHLFTPQGEAPAKEGWYLIGAWLLGATMNAVMTWWAVNLTLLNHEFGNEILNRQQILDVVPPFVAVLVWLTRILFIGAFSVAGDHLFSPADGAEHMAGAQRPAAAPRPEHTPRRAPAGPRPVGAAPAATPKREPTNARPHRRINRRPPMPPSARTVPTSMNARSYHSRSQ